MGRGALAVDHKGEDAVKPHEQQRGIAVISQVATGAPAGMQQSDMGWLTPEIMSHCPRVNT